jgi:hypothetical protein
VFDGIDVYIKQMSIWIYTQRDDSIQNELERTGSQMESCVDVLGHFLVIFFIYLLFGKWPGRSSISDGGIMTEK